MAGKKENLKALFTNTRSRVIIIFTFLILGIAVLVGLLKFTSLGNHSKVLDSELSGSPSIRSIPGAIDPTVQYAKLQEAQNVSQAKSALTTGQSAIPTIVRSQAIGTGTIPVSAAQSGQSGVGFSTLVMQDEGGIQKNEWLQALKEQACDRKSISHVKSEGGSLDFLKSACNCSQLKEAGILLNDLQSICPCPQLKSMGYGAMQFKEIGYSVSQLYQCGFSACETRAAGYSAQGMLEGGYSAGELRGAGFPENDIARASGLPPNISYDEVKNAGCQPKALMKLKAEGVTAFAIRHITGCTPAQLKAGQFTAAELHKAGFTAADLKNIGFNANDLKAAGFNARDLLNAGFTPAELKKAGFTAEEIAQAEQQLPPDVTPADVQQLGCDVDSLSKERSAGISAKLIREYAGCNVDALKAAGFDTTELMDAGFTPAEIQAANVSLAPTDAIIRAAGCDQNKLEALRQQKVSAKKINSLNGCSIEQLQKAGFTPGQLAQMRLPLNPLLGDLITTSQANCNPTDLAAARSQGISAASLKEARHCSIAAMQTAGYTAAELNAAGFGGEAIKQAGCDTSSLISERDAGITAKEIEENAGCNINALKAAGFSAAELADAGFTPLQIKEANPALAINDAAIRASDCDVTKLSNLHAQNISAKKIHDLNGCSAQQLAAGGYSAAQIADAGLLNTVASIPLGSRQNNCDSSRLNQARTAGIKVSTLRITLGCGADNLKKAGFAATELKNAGFTAAELKNAGFTPTDLKVAGFSASELRTAGYSAKDLKNVGFSPLELKNAGYTAAELKASGLTMSQLKTMGFSAKDLKDAGFTASELNAAGFSATVLKEAGFTAKQLKAANFTAQKLKESGFTASELKEAGFTANELKAVGFSAKMLKEAGFSSGDLRVAGFTANELKVAGYAAEEIAAAGFSDSEVAGLSDYAPSAMNPNSAIPTISSYQSKEGMAKTEQANAQQLQNIVQRQNKQLAEQKYMQKIQQRSSTMLGSSNQLIQEWKKVSTQTYTAGSEKESKNEHEATTSMMVNNKMVQVNTNNTAMIASPQPKALIKTGDILFAIIDTSVNSDEPSPILATVISGKLKGAKLIGSFNMPANAEKMVISFNTLSVPGASRSTSISAYAIDANTARTALSSNTDTHLLYRYGNLFASSFLEGLGSAFQSSGTSITIGSAGTGDNINLQNSGRSLLQNTVVALGDVGKAWGQVAQQNFNRPTTIEVYSGTGIGVLFTQDLTSL